MVPVRDVVFEFAWTSYETVPLPLPLAPLVMVIHAALLVAVQLHPPPVVTVILPDAAADVRRFADDGDNAKVHGAPG